MTLSVYCACASAAAKASTAAIYNFLVAFMNTLLHLRIQNRLVKAQAAPPSSYAEILVQLAHVRFQLCIGNHIDHASALHHVMPIRDGLREAKVLFHEQDRQSFRFELLNRAADLLHDDGCKAF